MKIKFSASYAVREIANQIEYVLGLSLGIPMNAELTNLSDDVEELEGTFTFHWECGWHACGRYSSARYEHSMGESLRVNIKTLKFTRPVGSRGRRDGRWPSHSESLLREVGASITHQNFKMLITLNREQISTMRNRLKY